MSREELMNGLEDIIQDLQYLDQNTTKLHEVASNLPSTDNKALKKGTFGGYLPRRSPKKVQVYSGVDTPKVVDTALKKLCKNMSYKCEIIKRIYTLQHDVPLIVVCPVASRLEPDIDHGLNGLDWQSLFIVLLLHQGNEDSLPGLPTERKLPEKPKYGNAKFVDMAYSLEFYACKMNEDAKQKIKEFVDSFKIDINQQNFKGLSNYEKKLYL